MGESGSVEAREAISPIEYLDKLCAFAMSIGMTYKEYWYERADMLVYYVEAEKLRIKNKNRDAWLQGLYVYIAIGNLVPVLNPFSKEHKAKPYLKQPVPITKEEQEEQEKQKVQRFINYMNSLVKKTEV